MCVWFYGTAERPGSTPDMLSTNAEDYPEFIGALVATAEAERQYGGSICVEVLNHAPYADLTIRCQGEEALVMLTVCPSLVGEYKTVEYELEDERIMLEAAGYKTRTDYECDMDDWAEERVAFLARTFPPKSKGY